MTCLIPYRFYAQLDNCQTFIFMYCRARPKSSSLYFKPEIYYSITYSMNKYLKYPTLWQLVQHVTSWPGWLKYISAHSFFDPLHTHTCSYSGVSEHWKILSISACNISLRSAIYSNTISLSNRDASKRCDPVLLLILEILFTQRSTYIEHLSFSVTNPFKIITIMMNMIKLAI